MKTNAAASTLSPTTHEGGMAGRQTPLMELTRAVSTCLLWENTFYEKGSDMAQRIAELCDHVSLEEIAALAVTARGDLKLRHVPLFLLLQMIRINSATKAKSPLVARTIAGVIQRADEMPELLSLYWRDGKRPLAASLKRGLAQAFPKFSAFQLAKWNRDAVVKLRDVLFLARPKSTSDEQAAIWKQLAEGTLEAPDTWEVALSAGADKKATWERLLREDKLGYMALLMNLRNMAPAQVEPGLVEQALRAGAVNSRALPFRFLTAAKHAPQFAGALSDAMVASVTERIPGRTLLVIDVSGSMDGALSAKSQTTRLDAAGALAVLLREMTPECRVFTFSQMLAEVQNWRGLPLVEGIVRSQAHGGTYLGAALEKLKTVVPTADRLIVVTDEQAHDRLIPGWGQWNYLINVGPYKPGLDISGGWTRITGWSERVVEWMRQEETAA
jgi:hypothetical protein